jgi:hypothetical protein
MLGGLPETNDLPARISNLGLVGPNLETVGGVQSAAQGDQLEAGLLVPPGKLPPICSLDAPRQKAAGVISGEIIPSVILHAPAT